MIKLENRKEAYVTNFEDFVSSIKTSLLADHKNTHFSAEIFVVILLNMAQHIKVFC